ncbi:MAG: gamma-glutamylcyclotransferase [Gammaproteobacteria bacterium]|nr:gamma-glutamylcyclotransferase [Gammaproteobacteria bacterium]
MLIFIYGTLLKGMSRNHVLEQSEFVGYAITRGLIYDLGSYPALTAGDNTVCGELYEVTDEVLATLDNIEGYYEAEPENSLYIREEISISSLNDGQEYTALTYRYPHEIEQERLINQVDYRSYLLSLEDNGQEETLHWYIAYGSNMSSQRLIDRVGAVEDTFKGYLQGYQLVFNKAAQNGSVYANIKYTGQGQCPFVAYQLTAEQFDSLDGFEGEPNHYLRTSIEVFAENNNQGHLAYIYLAHPGKIVPEGKPAENYLEYIIDGYKKHGFNTHDI